MAKCPICNSRKGKRKCLISDGFICSLCCGNIRKEEECLGCVFYQKPKGKYRRYSEVPAFSVSEMEDNSELESYGNAIEGALCSYDVANGKKLRDSDAIAILELLIDIYHYQDVDVEVHSEIVAHGLKYLLDVIGEDLKDVDSETIVKLLGVIRFVAKRRTNTGREYMNIIHDYVGRRIGTGIRVLQQ